MHMTLEAMNKRFRVIEDEWAVGSPAEQDEFLAELDGMTRELAQVTGAEAEKAQWLRRTVDRLSRNISVAQPQV